MKGFRRHIVETMIVGLALLLSGCGSLLPVYQATPPQRHSQISWNMIKGKHLYKPGAMLVDAHKKIVSGPLEAVSTNVCDITWTHDDVTRYKELRAGETSVLYPVRVERNGKIYYNYVISYRVPTRIINTSNRTEFGPPILYRTSPLRSLNILFSADTGQPVRIVTHSSTGFIPDYGYGLGKTDCRFGVKSRTIGVGTSRKAIYYEGYDPTTDKLVLRGYVLRGYESYITILPGEHRVRLFSISGLGHANTAVSAKSANSMQETAYLYIYHVDANGDLVASVVIKKGYL